jgi:hypothetical protein
MMLVNFSTSKLAPALSRARSGFTAADDMLRIVDIKYIAVHWYICHMG